MIPLLHGVITFFIITWTVQRATDCHLALVHDSDLERILGVRDGTVSTNHVYVLLLLIPIALGKPQTRRSDETPPKVELRDRGHVGVW
jgi:hypothetical protein